MSEDLKKIIYLTPDTGSHKGEIIIKFKGKEKRGTFENTDKVLNEEMTWRAVGLHASCLMRELLEELK